MLLRVIVEASLQFVLILPCNGTYFGEHLLLAMREAASSPGLMTTAVTMCEEKFEVAQRHNLQQSGTQAGCIALSGSLSCISKTMCFPKQLSYDDLLVSACSRLLRQYANRCTPLVILRTASLVAEPAEHCVRSRECS